MRRHIDFPRSRLPVSSVCVQTYLKAGPSDLEGMQAVQYIYRDHSAVNTSPENGNKKEKGLLNPSVFNHPLGHSMPTGIYRYLPADYHMNLTIPY